MDYINKFLDFFRNRKICAPAKLYLVISVIALIVMGMQNVGNTDIYCIGNYSCGVYSTILIFVLKLIYVIFWTWILNLICDAGVPYVSWFLVLFPFLLLFLIIISFLIWG
jgi:hypothetical protein